MVSGGAVQRFQWFQNGSRLSINILAYPTHAHPISLKHIQACPCISMHMPVLPCIIRKKSMLLERSENSYQKTDGPENSKTADWEDQAPRREPRHTATSRGQQRPAEPEALPGRMKTLRIQRPANDHQYFSCFASDCITCDRTMLYALQRILFPYIYIALHCIELHCTTLSYITWCIILWCICIVKCCVEMCCIV